MTVEEQERQCVRVRKELRGLQTEIAGVISSLKAFGNSLIAEGNKLIEAPDTCSMDAEALCADAHTAVRQIGRYRELLVSIVDKQAESDSFGDLLA